MVRANKTAKMAAGWILPVSSTAPSGMSASNVIQANPIPQQPVLTVPAPPGPVPSAPAQQMPQTGGLDPISSTILAVNTNPYVVGVFMLLLNLGGRFLSLELTKKQEAFLQAAWVRPMIFFTVIFMATRNVVVAFWVTLLFFFIIWVVANENSPFCMIPDWCGHNQAEMKRNYLQNVQRLFQRDA